MLRMLWQKRGSLVKGGLFILAVAGVAVVLHGVVPPEPRWVHTVDPSGVFDAGDGRIASYRMTSGVAGGPLRIQDARTGDEIAEFLAGVEKIEAHGQSKDRRTFVALVPGDRPNTWRICGVDLQELREWQVDAPFGQFESFSFSPHCDFVAVRRPTTRETEKSYTIVETASGRVVAQIDLPPVYRLAFSHLGGCLVLAFHDEDETSHIRVVSTRTGKSVALDDASYIDVSPDSRWLIGDRGDEGIWLWDIAGCRWHGPLGEPPTPRKANEATDLLIDRGLVYLTARYYVTKIGRHRHSSVRVWNVRSRAVYHLDPPGDTQMFSPDSRLVVCTTADNSGQWQATAYDVKTVKPLWKRTSNQTRADPVFTSDSRRIIAALTGAGQFELLDSATGQTERTLPLAGTADLPLQLTRDGRSLAIAATPPAQEKHWLLAKVEGWLAPQPDTVPIVIHAFDLETGAALGEVRTEDIDQYWLTEDRRSLVTISSESDDTGAVATTICCWDMPPRQPLRWVLGVPSAFAALLLALHFGWRRLRRGKRLAIEARASRRA
jgi:hypothetical protein